MSKAVIEVGQISLFDVPVVESKEEKHRINFNLSPIDILINQYKDTCDLISKLKVGGIAVYIKDKVKHYTKDGAYEFDSKGFDIFPNTEILVANKESNINQVQKDILNTIDPEEYILRKGDDNIYIPLDKGIKYITPKGHIWNVNMEFKINDLCTVFNKNNTKTIEMDIKKPVFDRKAEVFNIGDSVIFDTGNREIRGTIFSIYNNGDTFNILYDDCVTPAFRGRVKHE